MRSAIGCRASAEVCSSSSASTCRPSRAWRSATSHSSSAAPARRVRQGRGRRRRRARAPSSWLAPCHRRRWPGIRSRRPAGRPPRGRRRRGGLRGAGGRGAGSAGTGSTGSSASAGTHASAARSRGGPCHGGGSALVWGRVGRVRMCAASGPCWRRPRRPAGTPRWSRSPGGPARWTRSTPRGRAAATAGTSTLPENPVQRIDGLRFTVTGCSFALVSLRRDPDGG